jgi:hypothetical protein
VTGTRPAAPAHVSRLQRLSRNIATAALAVVIFHAVSLASGKLEEARGLGWDGSRYADMVTHSLLEGTPNTRTRPLVPLVTRIPYALGMSITDSFHLLNYVYAFALSYLVCLLLERSGATTAVRVVVVVNLALCIATSKMFAYYPVQIDLGALAITMLAFYLTATDRHRGAGAACVLATAAREFGLAAALYGIHRAVRTGCSWSQALLAYGPSLIVLVAIRWWVAATGPVDRGAPLSAGDAVQNLAYWSSAGFIVAFLYFGVLIFGGISALLVLRPRWSAARLREEPELATFLAIIVAMTMAGNLDIWRYLVFALPVAVVLIGQYWRELKAEAASRLLIVMTMVTVITQRPLEAMSRKLYFRDWFPLYPYYEALPRTDDFFPVWMVRLAGTVLILLAVSLVIRAHRTAKLSNA